MDKLRVREVILVEGRYDKDTLAQVVDGLILPTDGFAIFQDKARSALFRRLAQERGVVILTDSDGGGVVIRSYLKGILPPDRVKEAFIPDRFGKERRKRVPGKEGKLGVEGMTPEVLREALRRAGATEEPPQEPRFTKATLYDLGLTGTPDAAARRDLLKKAFDLPQRLSTNSLMAVLNVLTTPEEAAQLLEKEREG